jgi:eukaryotic-like serine/threonine-protein kinase
MSDSGELTPGALVTPSIRLEKLLGRGGMGSVWIAQHLQLRTQVVVKFMTAERADNKEAQQRFRREAELAAQAKSPHVVQIFDHGISQLGPPYIAMELLEGEDLGKRIARDVTIEPRRFADWLSQACRGLARAHAKGIVHRDIKPENIFLCDNDGEVLVKVLDFGVAKGVFDPSGFLSTRTGAMLGTAYYMSPEQTMGKKDIDHRTDLWALAVVTFYALTGARPFVGDGIGPLVLSITTDPLPLPSTKNPALGGALDAWMTKALARSREERFQSAKELAEAFANVVGALDTSRTRSAATSWPTGPVPPPRNPDSASGEIGFAASTMAPSVSSEGTPRLRVSTHGSPRRGRTWLLTVGVGALIGVAGVIGLSASHRPAPSPSAAAPSALAVPSGSTPRAEPSPVETSRADANRDPAGIASSARAVAAPPELSVPRKVAAAARPAAALKPAPGTVSAAVTPPAASAKPPRASTPSNPLDMKIE